MRMSTSSKTKKQSKLMRFISAPIRTLSKAKNFYMSSLEGFAGKIGQGSQAAHLPRSFSVNSSSSNDDEDLRQLRRIMSAKKNGADAKNQSSRASGGSERRRPAVRVIPINVVKQPVTINGMGLRSYSVGLKMGRIDEERACTFEEEDEVDANADLYTRSRSYAVNRRISGFA